MGMSAAERSPSSFQTAAQPDRIFSGCKVQLAINVNIIQQLTMCWIFWGRRQSSQSINISVGCRLVQGSTTQRDVRDKYCLLTTTGDLLLCSWSWLSYTGLTSAIIAHLPDWLIQRVSAERNHFPSLVQELFRSCQSGLGSTTLWEKGPNCDLSTVTYDYQASASVLHKILRRTFSSEM